jgi:hypothetical protein
MVASADNTNIPRYVFSIIKINNKFDIFHKKVIHGTSIAARTPANTINTIKSHLILLKADQNLTFTRRLFVTLKTGCFFKTITFHQERRK